MILSLNLRKPKYLSMTSVSFLDIYSKKKKIDTSLYYNGTKST